MQRAPIACASCAQKKRKCDRLLPACSHCISSSTSEDCRYNDPPSPIGEVGPFVPIVSRHLPRAEIACEQCRSQKRACNRALPTCSRCQIKRKTCVYDTSPATKRAPKSPYPKAKTQLRTLYGPEIRTEYPVKEFKYIPALIHHFRSVAVLPATIAFPNSLAQHIQSTWMRSASTDPCLFHATLFSASAHLDGLQGITDNPRTIFHQLQAVRLLSERLREPHFRVNYETLGAVLGLGYFDMVIKNVDGVLAHNHGLMQMLATNHDHGPETEFLMGLANETHFILSMVNNTDALFLPHPNLLEHSVQPVHPLAGISPARLLYRILGRAAAGSRHDRAYTTVLTPDTVLDLISAARTVTQYAGLTESSTEESTRITTTAATSIPDLGAEALRRACSPFRVELGTVPKAMNRCIQLAERLCRNILLLSTLITAPTITQSLSPQPTSSRITTPPPAATATTTTLYIAVSCLREDIENLKATLPKIDFGTWLQHAPEAYAWVCFTAAAAAAAIAAAGACNVGNGSDDWSSFILTPMPVITARDSANLCVLREGWAYLRWLRGVVRMIPVA